MHINVNYLQSSLDNYVIVVSLQRAGDEFMADIRLASLLYQ